MSRIKIILRPCAYLDNLYLASKRKNNNYNLFIMETNLAPRMINHDENFRNVKMNLLLLFNNKKKILKKI